MVKAVRLGATAYDVEGDGPPVFLIHGLGLNRHMWQWLRPELVPHFKVVSFDLFGHGESGPPGGEISLSNFADQVCHLADGLGVERFAVVGFSLGGMIGRRLAIDHPERVTSLVVVSSCHDRTPDETASVKSRVVQARQNGPAATVQAALARWFSDGYGERNPAMFDLVERWVRANDSEIYPRIYELLVSGNDELVDAIEAIACPTLVITGAGDGGNSPDMARRMAARIPGAQVKIVADLRHMGIVEAPPQFNGPILNFLSGQL